MTLVGLGFGVIENLIIAIDADPIIMIIRSIVMGHAGYGFITGWFYGKGKKTGSKALQYVGFVIAWLLHGLYDFGLSDELEAYNRADRFIRVRYPDGKVPVKSLQEEKRKLESETDDLGFRKEDMKDEVSWVRKIDSILMKMRPEMYEGKEEKEAAKKMLDKGESVKPGERKSIIKLMETKKKELDERKREERSRGSKLIENGRNEPSL